jgi:hypothetical protein
MHPNINRIHRHESSPCIILSNLFIRITGERDKGAQSTATAKKEGILLL